MNKTAVLAYGRANPPTVGHEKLFNKAIEHAKSVDGTPHIYVSHSQDAKKNPLHGAEKISLIKKSLKKHKNLNVQTTSQDEPSILHIAAKLHKEGYNNLHVVAGSDRVDEYNKLLTKYNNVPSKHGHYSFKEIRVVSAGERDPDSDSVEGISGSKLRSMAIAGNKEGFSKHIISGLTNKEKLDTFDKIRSRIKEDYENNYRFDDGTPEGTKYMLSITPGTKEIICPNNEKWDENLGKCVPIIKENKYKGVSKKNVKGVSAKEVLRNQNKAKELLRQNENDPSLLKPWSTDKNVNTTPSKYTTAYRKKYEEESTIPYLLMTPKQKQKLQEENNQLTFDGYSTSNFDMCKDALNAFIKNIKEVNKSSLMRGISNPNNSLQYKSAIFKNYTEV